MSELHSIAQVLSRPEEQLRLPYDLIRQGYEPEFLATYRPDETGQLDRETLAKLKRAVVYFQRVQAHREQVKALLTQEQQWGDALEALIARATTIAEIDLLTRGLRSRKSSRTLVEKQVDVAKLGQAILTMEGEAPEDLEAWVAQTANVSLDEGKVLLAQVRRWLQLLLHEDPMLLDKLARALRRKTMVSITMLQQQDDKGIDEESQSTDASPPASVANAEAVTEPTVSTEPASSELASSETTNASTPNEIIATPEVASAIEDSNAIDSQGSGSAAGEQAASADTASPTTETTSVPSSETTTESASNSEPAETGVAFTTARAAALPSRRKKGPEKREPKAKSDAKLSPRQRRRRWLKGVLETYVKLRKPLDRLSPYQILMLGRGQRSQLIKLNLEYDINPMIHAARECFCTGRHPLHHWLLDVAEEGLRKQILPKLEQDLLAEYEESAQQNLLETAVSHLRGLLTQRPIKGRRILAIDAIGPKMAAVAIVDANGDVLHVDEIACNSSRNDIVAANVSLLGEAIHRFKVSLIVLSNGPARRFVVHTVKELLKQSAGSLAWTMVDRTGADAYCTTRLCLQELPKISRRHRAVVWLARRLQDPLRELLKIDPTRLRLGSYQRELPENLLDGALRNAVSESVAVHGVDVWNATEETLRQVPGVGSKIAKSLVQLRSKDELKSRQQLLEALRADWPEIQYRQALGFLRVYGSEESLDATAIHPDDYRLAQRLISNEGMQKPENAPEGWRKPSNAVVQALSADERPRDSEDGHDEAHGEEAHGEDGDATESTEDASAVDSQLEASSEEATATEPEPAVASENQSEESAATSDVGQAEGTSEGGSTGEVATAEGTEAATSDASSEPVERMVLPSLEPEVVPPLNIDVERIARGWQVGRERLRWVARCLQRPFGDARDLQASIPILDKVPTFDDLKPGMSAWAVIIGVADFGAFADLGPDCSGLIHVSRLSTDFVEDPHQAVQVGDLVQVWVVEVDAARKRVALSALPPGFRPKTHQREAGPDAAREGARDSGRRDGNRSPDARSRPGGEQRRSDPGRSGDSRGRGPAGRGGGGGGGARRNDGRGDRSRQTRQQDAETSQLLRERKIKIDQPKPVQPISDAMQKGKEPLRSFSDLMQYFQTKPEDATPSEPEGPTES